MPASDAISQFFHFNDEMLSGLYFPLAGSHIVFPQVSELFKS